MEQHNNYRVGDYAVTKAYVTQEAVAQLAAVSGDFNRIHLNDEAAQKLGFTGRIAHALFCEGMLSKIMGMQLPGEGTIILKQEFIFHKPAYIGDLITATVTISEIIPGKSIIIVDLQCKNQAGETLVTGTAQLKGC